MKRGTIGILREVYSKWERRAPLTPAHVQALVAKHQTKVLVQPCKKRIFSDNEYIKSGAVLTEDLSEASAIFGVKQAVPENLIPNRTYLFFSHTIKAQPENSYLLECIKEKNIRLIDYECITQGGLSTSPRLVAFGEYAGKAGMINTFRGLGQQLLKDGYSTPYLSMGSAYMYPSYNEAIESITKMGNRINEIGIHQSLTPTVFAFTGTGKVTTGALEVFQKLPNHMLCEAAALPEALVQAKNNNVNFLGCVFAQKDLVARRSDGLYERNEYLAHPELYRSVFAERAGPFCDVVVNGVYWDSRYPRVISKTSIDEFKRLKFVADISCDIDGGVAQLTRSCEIEEPFYPINQQTMIMGVDILPSELPLEASDHFGNMLIDFVPPLAEGVATDDLPQELQGACIADDGKLTARYSYIDKMYDSKAKERAVESGNRYIQDENVDLSLAVEGSGVFRLSGHLFDSGLINKVLDVVEDSNAKFHILDCLFKHHSKTVLMLQVTMPQGRPELDRLEQDLITLIAEKQFTKAEATMVKMPETFCGGNYQATIKQMNSDDVASTPNTVYTIFGAGMVAGPAVEYLSRRSGNLVRVVSAFEGEAESLCAKQGRANVQAIHCDIFEELDELVAESDVVMSLLPATMHVRIAESCIQAKVPMVTASYVSPEMQDLHDSAVNNGVAILSEMGLDPGMDHMSAMKVIDEMGSDVRAFSSVCGGLPAPEAADNAFGYKFSWSPRGVLSALQNSATYLHNGNIVHVPGDTLLKAAEPVVLKGLHAFNFEQLPNRDSLKYGDVYGIENSAYSLFRGTLRYQGFSELMHAFNSSGFLRNDVPLGAALKNFHNSYGPLESICQSLKLYDLDMDVNALDQFCHALETTLVYGPGERDMVIMQHSFNHDEKVSTFLLYGDDEVTAMAKTVGVTAACGAELLKEEQNMSGILRPTAKKIYLPVLEKLANEGMGFKEDEGDTQVDVDPYQRVHH